MDPEVQAALIAVRSVVETSPYDAIEAAQALHRLAVLVPPHIEPLVHKAGQSVAKSIEHPGTGYDSLARSSLKDLVTAMERSFLRVVK